MNCLNQYFPILFTQSGILHPAKHKSTKKIFVHFSLFRLANSNILMIFCHSLVVNCRFQGIFIKVITIIIIFFSQSNSLLKTITMSQLPPKTKPHPKQEIKIDPSKIKDGCSVQFIKMMVQAQIESSKVGEIRPSQHFRYYYYLQNWGISIEQIKPIPQVDKKKDQTKNQSKNNSPSFTTKFMKSIKGLFTKNQKPTSSIQSCQEQKSSLLIQDY